jgi:two-component sensor histidine kinase/ABC-type nitrate/sulfonate/bicarbonate transport system substrate-binding protein
MKIKRKIIALQLCLITCMAANVFALEKVALQLSWYHQFEYAGYYAAREMGYYKDEGIPLVEIKAGGPEIDEAHLVATGKAQYGSLASEILVKRINGMPLVVLSAIQQHSKRVIIVRAESDIYSPFDLIGKTIMLNLHEHEEFLAMFLREGIDPEKINIIHKDRTAIQKLIDNKIVGMNGSFANQPYTLKKKGISTRLIRPISYGIDFYGSLLFTTESEIERNPERVEAFRRASIKGWQYAFEHPEKVIDLILKKYNPKLKKEQLQYEAKELRKVSLPNLIEMGHINRHRLVRIADTYAELGIIPKDYSLKGFIYDPVTKKEDWNATLRQITSTIIIVLFCLVGLVTAWVINLRRSVAAKTVTLTTEIERRRLSEDKTSSSEQLLREVINSMDKAIAVYEPIDNGGDFRFVETNEFAEKIMQYKTEDVIGKTIKELFPGEPSIGLIEKLKETFLTGKSTTIPLKQYQDDRITQRVENYIFKLPSGKVVAMFEDTFEQRRIEEQIKASLKEKETLLQEIHHRVKNNMQVLSSLISLQSNQIDDDLTKNILKESHSRIYAMSAIHETLHQSTNLSEIDLNTYLTMLGRSLVQTYTTSDGDVILNIDCPEIKININKANPLGLTINELISNSLKYAFPKKNNNQINISAKLSDEKDLEIVVNDSGVGMPKDFDWAKTNTLGLQLVRDLVEKQLKGSVDMKSKNGTKFTIKFQTET